MAEDSHDVTVWICAIPDCEESIKKGRWSQIKRGENWFFTMDDKAFCPKHVPSWVAEWRAKKKAKA